MIQHGEEMPRNTVPQSGQRTLIAALRQAHVPGILLSAGFAGFLASLAFSLHLNLSSTGSLELLFVVVVALRFGFAEATAASLVAAVGLNILFVPPIFKLTVADPANWVSLATFEITAILVSRLSTRVRLNAVEAEVQRSRSAKLYELSRAILLIDGRSEVQRQVCELIREIIQVDDVHLALFAERIKSLGGGVLSMPTRETQPPPDRRADRDDGVSDTVTRVLSIGATAIGTLSLRGWEEDASLADAVASLAAIAVERARAVQEESRAENERDTERLRAAVLDGLAHGFKTPLTAIQTASSGLLAIGGASPIQTELITIIDEQATLLNALATKLLRTASLESRQVRLHRTEEFLHALTERAIDLCEPAIRPRVRLHVEGGVERCRVDAELVTLALAQLIDNATKYSKVNSPVEIFVKQDEEEATVAVENTGTPIAPEEQEKIFERFYRGSNTSGNASGTGLGLSVVRKAAAAHHGRVWLQSDEEKTTFFFAVPRKG